VKSSSAPSIRLRWLASCAAFAAAYAPDGVSADPPNAASSSAPRGIGALIYAQNPVRTPAPQLAELALEPAGLALSHPYLLAQSCVDEGKTVALPTDRGGRALRVCTPTSTARPDVAGTYTASPRREPTSAGADPFAEAMLFHHGARTLAYFAELGLSPPWPSHKTPLRLVANVRMPAAYLGVPTPSTADAPLVPWPDALFVAEGRDRTGLLPAMNPQPGDAIWFGEGATTRFAYDGDVIVHEVSHALLAPLLPDRPWYRDEQGASGAHTALDEGLADYFAAAMNGDPTIGEYASQDAALWQQRSIDAVAHCPQALVGRRRPDSLLLSSALWSIRKPLAPRAARLLDGAVMTALIALRDVPTLSLDRLLESVASKLAVRSPALAKAARREFGRRGLLPACTRVNTLDPAQSLAGQTDSFLAPGTRAVDAHALAPGVVQFRVRIPRGTRVVRLRFRAGKSEQAPLEHVALTPFRPVLLAKRGAPLRWTADGQHDADTVQELALSALCTARIEVSGAGELYAQVTNAGEQDGFYDDLAVAFERDESAAP